MRKIIRKIKKMKLVKVIYNKNRREYLGILIFLVFLIIVSMTGAGFSFLYGIGNSSIYSSFLSLFLILLSFVLFVTSLFGALLLPNAYYKTFGRKKRARRRR